jgi:hypothetical protein
MMKNTILLLDKERYLGGGYRNFRFGIEDRRVFEIP